MFLVLRRRSSSRQAVLLVGLCDAGKSLIFSRVRFYVVTKIMYAFIYLWSFFASCICVYMLLFRVATIALSQGGAGVRPSPSFPPFPFPSLPSLFTARCYASVVLAMGLCLCLCPSVCHKSRSSTKTAKNRITQTAPHDSPGTLVF